MEKTDIAFVGEDDTVLRGWLFRPDAGAAPRAAISMAHGFGAVKEHALERFARRFAESGFVVLVHDHRGFGASDGAPRHDIDPWRQLADWRRAISVLQTLDGVDPDRIGIWGSSYAGGHVIQLGATDRRVKCVVAQVPTISGFEQGRRRVAPDATADLERRFAADDHARLAGADHQRTAIATDDMAVPAAYRSADAIAFYHQGSAREHWTNDVTLRSTRLARSYEPGIWAPRVSPTPILFVVAKQDTVTVTDLALEAYERALEPKRLVLVDGGHFAPYDAAFEAAASAADAFFVEQLRPIDGSGARP